jgi:DNA-binding response OmpR family regulator
MSGDMARTVVDHDPDGRVMCAPVTKSLRGNSGNPMPRKSGQFFSSRSLPVHGLAAGHEYVAELMPIETIELISSSVLTPTRVLRCANLEIRPSGFQALAAGRHVDLTRREFQLLLALAERRNRVVPRPELYEHVWHRRMAYRDRSVDVFVRKLRLKLNEAAPGWLYIHTHFGVGYRFAPERAFTK